MVGIEDRGGGGDLLADEADFELPQRPAVLEARDEAVHVHHARGSRPAAEWGVRAIPWTWGRSIGF